MPSELTTFTDRERVLIAQALEVERRKRRKVQLALAVAVLMLLMCGGAFAWWHDRQAQERRLLDERTRAEQLRIEARLTAEQQMKTEQARQGVRINLALAADLQKQGKFKEATVALDLAAQTATSGAPELLPEVERAMHEFSRAFQADDEASRAWFEARFGTPADRIAPPPREVKR